MNGRFIDFKEIFIEIFWLRRRLAKQPITITIFENGGSITVKSLGGPNKVTEDMLDRVTARLLAMILSSVKLEQNTSSSSFWIFLVQL